jgi:uncharacterized protein (TIGR02217 family)
MSDFLEWPRLNDGRIILNCKFGMGWSTSIVTTNSGLEQRQSAWLTPLGEYEVGEQKMTEPDFVIFRNYFAAVRGQAKGFRLKDPGDYKDEGCGILGMLGFGDGGTSYQMFKSYSMGSEHSVRKIRKPVPGTVKVFKNTVDITATSTIDTTTGMVTLAVAASGTDSIIWTGEFDIPVRFTVDKPSYENTSHKMSAPGVIQQTNFYVHSHPMREIKY